MRYIEALASYRGPEKSLFLAGGITGCPDWQKGMVEMLSGTDLVLFNPRRAEFPIHDPLAAEQQIRWENLHLRYATEILFWFPCETLCPIVLYELGAWSMTNKRIYIGMHPDYPRRQDVEIQTKLIRSDVAIVYSLEDLAEQVYVALLDRPAST